MILSFMTKWGKDMPPHMAGKPTYFPEKILANHGNKLSRNAKLVEVFNPSREQFKKGMANPFFPHHPKLHTIREDVNNRWKVGMPINFYINSRQPNMFEFAPAGIVKSIQLIEIKHFQFGPPMVIIDNKKMYLDRAFDLLVRNDGFDSVFDFFAYFNKDFSGRLIHWTDLKY